MPKEYCFYTYIMASESGVLYIGVTNNLYNRVTDHKNNKGCEFTAKYACHKLVFFEEYQYIEDAINREKQLKKWRREKKINLVTARNSKWKDLFEDWS